MTLLDPCCLQYSPWWSNSKVYGQIKRFLISPNAIVASTVGKTKLWPPFCSGHLQLECQYRILKAADTFVTLGERLLCSLARPRRGTGSTGRVHPSRAGSWMCRGMLPKHVVNDSHLHPPKAPSWWGFACVWAISWAKPFNCKSSTLSFHQQCYSHKQVTDLTINASTWLASFTLK